MEQSLADLTRQLSLQTTQLVRQEVELAKAELRVKGKRAGAGLRGRKKVRQATPPMPEQALQSVKEDVRFTKQRAEEARR